jgi:hypothetical protein
VFDQWQGQSGAPEEKPSKLDSAKPVIGLAICICTFVVSIMVGFYAICGPGGSGGYNREGTPGPLASVAVFFLFASVAGVVGCFIWLIVALVVNSSSNSE